LIEAKGYLGGTVSFDGEWVTISRKGLNRLTVGKGTKRVHASQITAVQLKPAGPLINGFIQFSIPGGTERRSAYGSQTKDAVRDENSVVFTKKQQPPFEQLRDAIEAAISGLHRPAAPAPSAGLGSELAQLAQLRATGALSEAEFQTAKQSLLHG
jgi:hypothetical protein